MLLSGLSWILQTAPIVGQAALRRYESATTWYLDFITAFPWIGIITVPLLIYCVIDVISLIGDIIKAFRGRPITARPPRSAYFVPRFFTRSKLELVRAYLNDLDELFYEVFRRLAESGRFAGPVVPHSPGFYSGEVCCRLLRASHIEN